jgi:sortase family protein
MIAVGLNRDDSLRVPASTRKVRWWRGGTKAGRKGAAVIVGHVDSQSGPAVFYRLKELSPRARIKVVHNDGSQAQLRGHGSRAGSKDDFPIDRIYDDPAQPTVRLVTCAGSSTRRAATTRTMSSSTAARPEARS